MDNPITVPLPKNLPTDWTYGQTVAPNGSDAGLAEQYGYNYLMEQVNAAQQAAEEVGEAIPNLVPTSKVGQPNGVASLGSDGKVPAEQIPDLDFLPASGGTVTGPIILPGNPTEPLQAASKQYVDAVGINSAAVIRSYPVSDGQTVTAGQVVDVENATPTVGQFVSGNIQVQNVPVGNIISLTENNTPQYYLVIHHGLPSSMYDASCNGTWVLRLNIYDTDKWDADRSNALPGADIFTTMAGMLSLFNAETQSAIKTVKIPYCVGGGSATVQSGGNGLQCQIFPLSGYEVGWTSGNSSSLPEDGTVLSYFAGTSSSDPKRIAYKGIVKTDWWLRSPYISNANSTYYVRSSNGRYNYGRASSSYGVRPAFILDPAFEVDGYYKGISGTITTSGTPSQAISLQSGNAGETIEVIYSGTVEANWIVQGQQIISDGVKGSGILPGILQVLGINSPGVKVITGSYVGTGLQGSGNSNTIEFQQGLPKIVFIIGGPSAVMAINPRYAILFNPPSEDTVPVGFTFAGSGNASPGANINPTQLFGQFISNIVSWYGKSALDQLNEDGVVYNYYALF